MGFTCDLEVAPFARPDPAPDMVYIEDHYTDLESDSGVPILWVITDKGIKAGTLGELLGSDNQIYFHADERTEGKTYDPVYGVIRRVAQTAYSGPTPPASQFSVTWYSEDRPPSDDDVCLTDEITAARYIDSLFLKQLYLEQRPMPASAEIAAIAADAPEHATLDRQPHRVMTGIRSLAHAALQVVKPTYQGRHAAKPEAKEERPAKWFNRRHAARAAVGAMALAAVTTVTVAPVIAGDAAPSAARQSVAVHNTSPTRSTPATTATTHRPTIIAGPMQPIPRGLPAHTGHSRISVTPPPASLNQRPWDLAARIAGRNAALDIDETAIHIWDQRHPDQLQLVTNASGQQVVCSAESRLPLDPKTEEALNRIVARVAGRVVGGTHATRK